jgi:uncharacterized coiled-coil DUF342 family protein
MPDKISAGVIKIHNQAAKIAEMATAIHDALALLEEEIETLREKMADAKATVRTNPNRPKRKAREMHHDDNDPD